MDHNNNNEINDNKDDDAVIDMIMNVRKQFLNYYENNRDSFHINDIDLIKTNDWWTLRFLKWNRFDEQKSLEQMINAFKWRKDFGINDRNINDLPIEFAKSAALFPLHTDYKNRNVLYMRAKVYRKIQVLDLFFRQFFAGVIDYVDEKSGPNGFVIVFDASGIGWSNLDGDFLQFITKLLQLYYPYGLRYTICLNVPKILRPLWSIFKVFMGSADRSITFCHGKELLKYIPEKNVPCYLGGQCKDDFTDLEETKNCLSIKELGLKFGFTPKEIENYFRIFEPHLKEAETLVNFK